MSLYVETIPNRNSPPVILLRESTCTRGKVTRRTVANLSRLSPEVVDSIRLLLKGGRVVSGPQEAFTLQRSWPHGHVGALLGLCRLLHRHPGHERLSMGGWLSKRQRWIEQSLAHVI